MFIGGTRELPEVGTVCFQHHIWVRLPVDLEPWRNWKYTIILFWNHHLTKWLETFTTVWYPPFRNFRQSIGHPCLNPMRCFQPSSWPLLWRIQQPGQTRQGETAFFGKRIYNILDTTMWVRARFFCWTDVSMLFVCRWLGVCIHLLWNLKSVCVM